MYCNIGHCGYGQQYALSVYYECHRSYCFECIIPLWVVLNFGKSSVKSSRRAQLCHWYVLDILQFTWQWSWAFWILLLLDSLERSMLLVVSLALVFDLASAILMQDLNDCNCPIWISQLLVYNNGVNMNHAMVVEMTLLDVVKGKSGEVDDECLECVRRQE